MAKRFSIYDAMEERGVFSSNPANVNSHGPNGEVIYRGPVEFPKMLYHPKGEMKITTPAEAIATPFGPKWVGEKKEIIHRWAANAEEEAALVAEGWHHHPSGAIVASGGAAPPISDADKVKELERELAALRASKDEPEGKAPRGAAKPA